jgi:hypothetical protein
VGVRLREAGRFVPLDKTTLDLGRARFANSLQVKSVVDYVVNRQNDDGGYTFCQGAESNAQDTYYGLAILSMLDASFPNIEKTDKWLKELDLNSVYSYYYVCKALTLCGKDLNVRIKNRVVSMIDSKRHFGGVDVYVEVSSEFVSTFMILELASMLNVELESREVENWLLEHRNKDGGFGAHGYSNLNSTYHAIASLHQVKGSLSNLGETVSFVRKCEKPYGGFTVVPLSSTPYMEHTYYGAMTLNLLDKSCKFPSQTIDFILKCQRANGGFARSDMGISTFENTFQAVSMLRKFGVI